VRGAVAGSAAREVLPLLVLTMFSDQLRVSADRKRVLILRNSKPKGIDLKLNNVGLT